MQDIEAFVAHDCVIRGGLAVAVYSLDLQGNDIEGEIRTAGFGSQSPEGPAVVRRNRFDGGRTAYAVTLGDFGPIEFSENVVRGYAAGVRMLRCDCRIVGNRVEDCGETGIAVGGERAVVRSNHVERCGTGISLDLYSRAEVVDSVVLASARTGWSSTFDKADVAGTSWGVGDAGMDLWATDGQLKLTTTRATSMGARGSS